MGSYPSALQQCLESVGNGRADFAGFPGSPTYQPSWVRPYNLDLQVVPAAVVRPQTAEDVSGIVKCAAENGVKVQAKSGGHSYGNYGLGGVDGAVAIDMVKMQHFSIDNSTWRATLGPGTLLGQVSERLHNAGGRAIAHGVCPAIGIGGHATIGGLGPMSRMWGTALDHVVEVEVVTADGKIQRASETENSDLFWALRGASSAFGIITEFVVQTHPEPGSVVQYRYTISFGNMSNIAPLFSIWLGLIKDPNLDRRFGSMFVLNPTGAFISGTFYGTQAEFEATRIPDRFPDGPGRSLVFTDWMGSLAHNAEQMGLYLTGLPMPFACKSVAFRREDLPPPNTVAELFRWFDAQDKGTLLWFIIFDNSGGAIAEVPLNATAFAHRDKVLYYQSYAVGLPLSDTTRRFVANFHNKVLEAAPTAFGTYPGYVDPALADAQEQYWGPHLARLREIKLKWDSTDVFQNPQSVRVPRAD
ncbi:hypothetical protein VTK26DRAFT_890 [Humicola hyalothermophila]